MVADTHKWLPGRKVLISPISLREPEWADRRFPVNLTKQQIENSPPLEEHEPICRQYEKIYSNYYFWPYYWEGDLAWGLSPYPPLIPRDSLKEKEDIVEDENEDPEATHLRSIKEVHGYHIKARDGEIGHVEDFIVDDETWTLCYLVVDTRNWLPGRKVLISPKWIQSMDCGRLTVEVDLTTEDISNSPEYDPATPINREYEARLYDYYGRPVYWEKESKQSAEKVIRIKP